MSQKCPTPTLPFLAELKARELERMEINRQLKSVVIEASISYWVSPVLHLPKKDGKLLFFIDYMKFNSMNINYTHPLSRLDDYIDTLSEAH